MSHANSVQCMHWTMNFWS